MIAPIQGFIIRKQNTITFRIEHYIANNK